MSPALNKSSALQCIKPGDVLKIHDSIIFQSGTATLAFTRGSGGITLFSHFITDTTSEELPFQMRLEEGKNPPLSAPSLY